MEQSPGEHGEVERGAPLGLRGPSLCGRALPALPLDGGLAPSVHSLAVRGRTLSGQEGARFVGFILSTFTPF